LKRELPFLSPLSILFTFLVLAGLGFSLWKSGGLGFSPGPVSAYASPGVSLQGFRSHVEFEQECKYCHQPLQATQDELCATCHANVAEQQAAGSGTHGRLDAQARCADCHPEHRGRDFDPVEFAVQHFDHAATALALTGAHAALECDQCHAGGDYSLVYTGCAGCHAEPALHAGLFLADCATCHTDLAWTPAQMDGLPFDHETTGFSLARHADLAPSGGACTACHVAPDGTAQHSACQSCHAERDGAFMTEHLAQVGEQCLQCHDGVDRMAGFDHQAVFPLAGQHAALDCASCHAGFRFAGTPAECAGCHAEPEIHAGFFGLQCQECHSPAAWTPARLTEHIFPLDHGSQGEVTCQTCHPASYPDYTCYGCHEHQPDAIASEHREENIAAADLAQCVTCHADGTEEDSHDED
jgi:hypothetical protein